MRNLTTFGFIYDTQHIILYLQPIEFVNLERKKCLKKSTPVTTQMHILCNNSQMRTLPLHVNVKDSSTKYGEKHVHKECEVVNKCCFIRKKFHTISSQ